MSETESVGKRIARTIAPVTNWLNPQSAGGALRRILEVAIDGTENIPGARASAKRHLQKHGGAVDDAVDALIDFHVRLASANGFATNIGGIASLPVAVPANLTGVAVIQVRMVAAIAHLRGYDLNDNRVRTALVMCLLGGESVARNIVNGKLPTSPLAIATAPVFDPELDQRVAQEVLSDLVGRVGGRNIALVVTKRIPLIGGGVGAVLDGIATHQIGRYAKTELVRRRVLAI